MVSTVTSNPVYIPRSTVDGVDAPGRSDRSRGSTGSLEGHTVEHAPVPNLPAKSSGIGAWIANFFTSDLPRFFSEALTSILSRFRPVEPRHAEAAAAPPVSRTADPFDPAVNAGLNAPFSEERTDNLTNALRLNIDPEGLRGSMADIAVSGRAGNAVTEAFAVDINRIDKPLRFNGIAMDDVLSAPRANDAHENLPRLPRVIAWCDSMATKGVDARDMAVFTRIVNQSTFGILMEQYIYRPDLVPVLKLPDGRETPVMVDYSTRDWNIRETDTGFAIDCTFGGPFTSGVTTDYDNVAFGQNSYASQNFTIVLDRDDAGQLQAAFTDCRMRVDAYDIDGQPLT